MVICGSKMKGMNNRRIYGVDFSGGEDAAKKIWITEARINDDVLKIVSSSPASELPESPRKRDDVLKALRGFIEDQQNAIFGLDFPFGLPKPIVNTSSWEEFIREFPQRFNSAKNFYEECKLAGSNLDGEGIEYDRLTETEKDAPFCSYNLWMYKQTFYGISRLLHPFVIKNSVSILPMQSPDELNPWVIEICPSSTLRSLDIRRERYKGAVPERVAGRQEILEDLADHNIDLGKEIFDSLLADDEGDALDSIIAAFAVYRTFKNKRPGIIDEPLSDPYDVEGYIFD